jgi:hypothetical protein
MKGKFIFIRLVKFLNYSGGNAKEAATEIRRMLPQDD